MVSMITVTTGMSQASIASIVSAFFFFSSRRRHTRFDCDWSSDVCSSDLPRSRMRSSIRRTWRSVTFNRLAAATCVRCFCFTSCNTFNRSRSRWLKAMRSVSMGPSANHESGHFYFAQTGHSHFAATAFNGNIDNGARFGYHLPREVRTVAPSGGDVSQSSLVSPPDHSVGEDARRSTRIERSVPLIVFGQNRLGEPFVERTVSTSLNLHGCRYPSRHDYGVGPWGRFQILGLNVEPKPPAVRARVRSVHTSQSL